MGIRRIHAGAARANRAGRPLQSLKEPAVGARSVSSALLLSLYVVLISELFSSPPLALDNPRSRLRRPRSYLRRGRSFSSSCSSHRHAIEPKRDRHKPEEHKLSAAVVDVLDRARSKRSFEDFIIVAPRRRIGEIRALLSERVRDCLR